MDGERMKSDKIRAVDEFASGSNKAAYKSRDKSALILIRLVDVITHQC